jgi:hypothetical protein
VLPPGFTLLLCNFSCGGLHNYNHYDSESDTQAGASGAAFLLAVGRALARIHVQHDDPGRSPLVH